MIKEAIKEVKGSKDDRLALSISKLKVFESCPFRYYLKYIEKAKVDKKDFNPKFYKVGQFAHKYIDSTLKGIPCIFNSTTLTDDDKKEIQSRCDLALQDKFVKNLIKMKHETEVPFSMNFDLKNYTIDVVEKTSRKADFSGFVDFLGIDGDTLYVIDWKTGGVMKDNPQSWEQVLLYAKAMLKLRGNFKKIIVGYYFIDHNKKMIKEVTPEEIDSMLFELFARGLKIPSPNDVKDFPANPGDACKWCEYGNNGNGVCNYKAETIR